MRPILAGAALLLSACAHAPLEFDHEVTLTSGVTFDFKPVDARERFSLDEQRLYVHLRMFNAEQREQDFHVEVLDGRGDLVYTGGQVFTPNQRTWNVWAWHIIDPVTNAPGRWRILVYLDGDLIDTLRVRMLPAG